MKITAVSFLLLFFCCCSHPENKNQSPPIATPDNTATYKPVSQELFDEISLQDSLMFARFNAHDSVGLMRFFSGDLEFYHDKGGLADYEGTAHGFHRLFDANKESGMRRDLVPGSMEVYPVPGFGAIETCLHRFTHKENGKEVSGTTKNLMIWKKTGEQWQVTRVVSYDH